MLSMSVNEDRTQQFVNPTDLKCRDLLVPLPSLTKTQVPIAVSRVEYMSTTCPGTRLQVEPTASRGDGPARCVF
jgi:hypothetical protein